MSNIVLRSNYEPNGAFIPNLFIDNYMPAANGAYVKVYLYLLRCTSVRYISDGGLKELDISSIADHLDNTENDILRALSYWEKMDIVTLIRDNHDQITSIILNDIYSSHNDNLSEDEPAATIEQVHHQPSNSDYEDKLEELKDLNDDNIKQYQFEKPTYSDLQIKQLTNTDDVKWMLNIIELYLQRLIKPTDLQLILYMYESLDFSTELILYLYEYCVSKNKTHPSYVEAVALSWAKNGIDTLEKAEASTAMFNENYNLVKKAFGLDRALGHVEKQYINKWVSQYKFPIDLVIEACNRTLLSIQKPDFKYTDKIIENWHDGGVTSINEINALDEEHSNKSKKESKNNEQKKQTYNNSKNTNANKFNAFPQRSYSKEDYSSLEQKLLHKKNIQEG